MENLFSKDDIYIYRGIIHFYQGNYHQAIADFKDSARTKRLFKFWDNDCQSPESSSDDDEFSHSNDSDMPLRKSSDS